MSTPPVHERLLRRPVNDRVVFGVASGLARFFGVDVVFVRLAFVLLALVNGLGVLAYIILALVVPEGDEPAPLAVGAADATASDVTPPELAPRHHDADSSTKRVLFGAGLVAVGALLLVGDLLGDLSEYLIPVAVLAAGAWLILRGAKQ